MSRYLPVFRGLAKQPAFTLLAVLTLALGIGINVGIFSALEALVLNPLPYPEAHRLISIYEDASWLGYAKNTPAPANFRDWQRESRSFAGMGATAGCRGTLTGGSQPEEVNCRSLTPNLLPILGTKPMIGRWFEEAEDIVDPKVVLLSEGLWRRRFGADPQVAGKSIQFNGRAVTVVGVMPDSFRFPQADIEMWIPIGLTPQRWNARSSHFLSVYGRLAPGVSMNEAKQELQAIQKRINQAHPEDCDPRMGIAMETLRDRLLGKTQLALWVLMGASAMVLLIACANVANLLLTRATGRQRELAIRSALGASTAALMEVIFAETLLLTLIGGLGGMFVAWASQGALEALIPESMLGAVRIELDERVLGFALLASFLAAVLASVTPLLHILGAPLVNLLRQDSRASAARSTVRLRNVLVVGEVALTVTLLGGAALMTRSLFEIWNAPLGFDATNLYSIRVSQSAPKYTESAKREVLYQRSMEKIRALPGIEAVSFAATPPFFSTGNSNGYMIEGITPAGRAENEDILVRNGTTNYLQMLGAKLKEGRFFTEADRAGAMPVAIVNEFFGRKHFKGQSPIGKRICVSPCAPNPVWRTIVGVVVEVRERGYDLNPKQVAYTSSSQMESWTCTMLLVRGRNVAASIPAIRRAILEVDSDQPIGRVQSFDDLLAIDQASRRQQMFLLGAFSGLSLLLACLGIYAILSYSVELRRNELGVRIAIGATGCDLIRLVVGQGMRLALAGTALGLVGAVLLGRWLETSLYGVKPFDPLSLSIVCGLLLTTALVACLEPALRAARRSYFWQLAQ